MYKYGTFLNGFIPVVSKEKYRVKDSQSVPVGDCDYIMVSGYCKGKGYGNEGFVKFNFALSINGERYDTEPFDSVIVPMNVSGIVQASKCLKISGAASIALISIESNEDAFDINCSWGKNVR